MSGEIAEILVRDHGRTFCEEAGFTLRDKPSALWQLLVLSLLLSARIDAAIGLRAAGELRRAGYRTPRRMRDSTWQQRVDALGRGGYRRYDEKTATQLDEAAALVLDRWDGDLRTLHEEAGNDPGKVSGLLQEVKGIGPAGATIFLREVQSVWTDLQPFIDDLAAEGARAVGLPADGRALATRVTVGDFPRLVAACVRVGRDAALADSVRAAAR